MKKSEHQTVLHKQLRHLLSLLASGALNELEVIPWATPVPCFGRYAESRIATVGLNPSEREFGDADGYELEAQHRRLPTLSSLGIKGWPNTTREQIAHIAASCECYFENNPYSHWFDQLESLFSSTGLSYYWPVGGACHLDLTPFATSKKWSELTSHQTKDLKRHGASTLSALILDSKIDLLILNGSLVVSEYEKLFSIRLGRREVPRWDLHRRNGQVVRGKAFEGISKLTRADGSTKCVKVLGFNHNIQSSFGVTTKVRESIRDWITSVWNSIADEC